MDLQVVFFILLQQLLVISSFQAIQATQHPTSKHSQILNAKEAKEELKLRRKHVRQKGNISLKPAPEDWPQPAFGAGDFLEGDPPQTSVSPLQAYQAKLEQEFIRQKEKEEQVIKRETDTPPLASQSWTSSEEDFKKLLDPGELLKHNKQLRPFVNQGQAQKSLKKTKILDQQGNKESRPSEIKSLAGLKATSGSKKLMRKSKSAPAKVTMNAPSRRSKKRKDVQKQFMEDLTPLKELKKRKVKPTEVTTLLPKTKRRHRKVRKFAFAAEYSKEYDAESQTKERKLSRTKLEQSNENISEYTQTYPVTTSKATKATFKPEKTTEKLAIQGTKQISMATTATKCTKHLDSMLTNHTSFRTSTTTEKTLISKTSTPTTLTITKTAVTTTFTTLDKKNVIREKRKQMKQEMYKVIKEEELEGSFNDTDSDWTTSENERIPILNVTPRHALLSLLKLKIIESIDTILKENSEKADERK